MKWDVGIFLVSFLSEVFKYSVRCRKKAENDIHMWS